MILLLLQLDLKQGTHPTHALSTEKQALWYPGSILISKELSVLYTNISSKDNKIKS